MRFCVSIIIAMCLLNCTHVKANEIDLSRDYLTSKIGYDYDFDINAFLKKHDSPLGKYETPDGWAADIIKKACLKYNINQRVVLTRLEYEQGLITGRIETDVFGRLSLVRGNGNKIRWGRVCEIACGYGQMYFEGDNAKDKHYKKLREHYLGFSHQVFNCARFTRRHYRVKKYFPYILYTYTPNDNTAINYYTIWASFWPKDFED